MVASTKCKQNSKPIPGNKVSKPIMEKKRRARINKCLEQLKSLLETYYSTNIRKRKLEKADILELTVNHLRNLQKIQCCTAAASEFSDYQSGFRRCLANVNQYLLMADNMNGRDRWMLSQLSSKMCRSTRRDKVFSTLDSGVRESEAPDDLRRLSPPPAGHEEKTNGRSNAPEPNSAKIPPSLPSQDMQPPCGNKQDVPGVAPTPSVHKENSVQRQFHVVNHRNEAANTQLHVWRPW